MIEHADGYDDSLPTPADAADDVADPNPQDGGLADAPPNDGGHVDGAVDDQGRLLTADGVPAAPKGGES